MNGDLAARLVPQGLPSELDRPRLLRLLHHDRQHQLIALVAPSGYGKTTLLAQHARTRSGACVWLSLREAHQHPLVLASELLAAARTVLSGNPLASSSDATAQDLRDALLLTLWRQPQAVDLVFDALDGLGEDAVRWLTGLIANLPAPHRVLVSAFRADGLPLARLVSAGRARVIGSDALAFDESESQAYLRSRGLGTNAPEIAHRLEGWPAGLALWVNGPHTGLALTPMDLVRERLLSLPAALRSLVAELAVLDLWSNDRARQCGCALTGDWLAQLVRSGLPITPLGDGLYRPHMLLLETLEQDLAAQPERHAALHHQAARIAIEGDDWLHGVDHLRRGGFWNEACELAVRHCTDLSQRWLFSLVRQVFEAFPAARLTAEARALLGAALCETGQAVRGEQVLRELAAEGTRLGVVYQSLYRLMGYRGRYTEQEAWCRRGLTELDDPAWHLRMKQGLIWSLGERGRLEEAYAIAIEVVATAEATQDHVRRAGVMTQLSGLEIERGRFTEAEGFARRAQHLYERLPASGANLNLLHKLAEVCRLTDRCEEARALLDEALPVAERENHPTCTLLLEGKGNIAAQQGFWAEALLLYQRSLEACGGYGLDAQADHVRLKIAQAALRAGQLDLCQRTLLRVAERSHEPGTLFWSGWAFTRGLAAFMSGQLELAKTEFERVVAPTSAVTRIRALAFRAEALRRQDRLRPADMKGLIDAFTTLPTPGAWRTDVDLLRPLFQTCLARGWTTATMPALIGDDGVPEGGEHSSPPLSPRERDVLALVAQGLTNKAIAERLGVSVNTVKQHLSAASLKLETHSRAEAVVKALRLGLIG